MAKQVIQYAELGAKWLVFKIPDSLIKKGTELLVRPGQEVVLCHNGMIADSFGPGRYELNEKSMPRLISYGERFVFPKNAVRTDIYFVNTTKFMNNGWGTKDPIIRKDKELDIIRLRAFGTYTFQISKASEFIAAIFGARILGTEKSEVITYLSSLISETVAGALGKVSYSIFDLSVHYPEIGCIIKQNAMIRLQEMGIELTEVLVEHIGTTDAMNDSLDDYTGMQLAKRDFETFEKYQKIKGNREHPVSPGMATINTYINENGHTVSRIVDK